MSFFYELYEDLPRQAPGDNVSTRKAFELLKELPANPEILDVGCGSGMQTLQLAKLTEGKITALDNHEPFLDELNRRAQKEGVADKIHTVAKSMFEMDFGDEAFDLIWSEGAVYIMGFEQGLDQWRRMLKKGGYFVVSELSLLRDDSPKELQAYWAQEYPTIKTIAENIETIEKLRYSLIDNFTLPEESWWENYYNPLKNSIDRQREKHAGDAEVCSFLDEAQKEIEMYRNYSCYYGYAFYIMQN